MKTALHLFRRDIRLEDNTSLLAASRNANRVITGFIFDPRQVGAENGYKSVRALRFLCESLEDLSEQITQHKGRLHIWHGTPATVLDTLLAEGTISAVHVNADYTPFSRDRDAGLAHICARHGVSFTAHHDALLTEPGTIRTGSGMPFKVFTPFYKAASHHAVATPDTTIPQHLCGAPRADTQSHIPHEVSQQYASITGSALRGGRAAGRALLHKATTLTAYKDMRDALAENGTTHLSAHNKFGTLSIREVYHALHATSEPLIRQLYWRDFFTHVAVAFPHVFGSAFNKHLNSIAWKNDVAEFARWCEGKTGFPIVDAGMRELNKTGYMHNRARLIVASFLTKDLHIDWRWGERYFAQKLIDYDPCVNNGSWQWSASTGCDAQPYFRIFNPWLQQKRFDPDAQYIKTWVPELKAIRASALHSLFEKPFTIPNYPAPMCNHRERSEQAKKLFKEL